MWTVSYTHLWLEPDGTFHGVEWGEHQHWADRYVEENFPEQYEEILEAGDWLVDRGWVLLHNPSQGVAFATGNLVRDMTKAPVSYTHLDVYKRQVITCKEVNVVGNDVWIKAPSGWMAGYYKGQVFIK